jgi:hypothetical protein
MDYLTRALIGNACWVANEIFSYEMRHLEQRGLVSHLASTNPAMSKSLSVSNGIWKKNVMIGR